MPGQGQGRPAVLNCAPARTSKVASANSEREDHGKRVALETGGYVGQFEVPSLRQDIADAIKNVQAGAVSDPVKTGDGYQIFRVDERSAGSDATVFSENHVREAMTIERGPKAHEDYLQNLRNEAYIKLAPSYVAGVLPLLKIKEEVTADATDVGSAAFRPASKAEQGKFLKIFRSLDSDQLSVVGPMRLDLFLKASRLGPARSIAQKLCAAGLVSIGKPAQSAHVIKAGDQIAIRTRSRLLVVRIETVPATRNTPRKEATTLYQVIKDERLADSD
jgi:ribosomal 50S subunit-recycling heat shock protein